MGRILNRRSGHISLLQVHVYLNFLPGATLNANVQMSVDHCRLRLSRAVPVVKSVHMLECEAKILST